jgi:hypothetical protein
MPYHSETITIIIIKTSCFHNNNAVGDADGDHVRCRWAESSLNECGDVCEGFPVTLNGRQVGCSCML